MAKWRVGIIGYGWVAGAHIEAIRQIPAAEVSAVCSARTLDAAELSNRHGGKIEVFHDLDTMLARPDINVVCICSVPHLHARQTIAAAQAGKQIIVEKPIALSLEDLRAMQKTVQETGVRTCVCFEVRWSDQFTMTKSLIDQGLLGKLHFGECDYYHGLGPDYGQYRWNITQMDGGSSLLSAGCHALDGLLMFMGQPVEEVFSYATGSVHADYARYEYPTTSVTVLKFHGGSLGKVASSIDALEPYYLRVHLFGSEGTLRDGQIFTTRVQGLRADRWTELGVKLESSGDVTEHPYLAQFKAFFDALDKDIEMPLTSLQDAVPTFEAIFAADRSVQLGRPVRLSEIA